MLEQVRNQPYVTFVKVPGSGKTDTLPQFFKKKGTKFYRLLIKTKLKIIVIRKIPQVFVIIDVLGLYVLERAELKT